jgi:hypothetical protein
MWCFPGRVWAPMEHGGNCRAPDSIAQFGQFARDTARAPTGILTGQGAEKEHRMLSQVKRPVLI